MADEASEFGARLALALRILNISRGTLASEARADKSLVSRWARGLAAPRGPYLSILTRVIAARAPGFTQLSWDLLLDAFTRALEGRPPNDGEADEAGGEAFAFPEQAWGVPHSRRQSALEIEREGHAYPGLYVAFRTAFRNTGEAVPDLIAIWRDGDRLYFRTFDPSFSHTGEVLVVRHQLFFVGEDDQRIDGLILYILNGVSGQVALRMDGLLVSVANDRYRTPSAAPVVFVRLADLAVPNARPADSLLAPIAQRMNAVYRSGEVERLIGWKILSAIRPVIGVSQTDGSVDHLLRRPMPSSLTASEIEIDDVLRADLKAAHAIFGAPEGGPELALTRWAQGRASTI